MYKKCFRFYIVLVSFILSLVSLSCKTGSLNKTTSYLDIQSRQYLANIEKSADTQCKMSSNDFLHDDKSMTFPYNASTEKSITSNKSFYTSRVKITDKQEKQNARKFNIRLNGDKPERTSAYFDLGLILFTIAMVLIHLLITGITLVIGFFIYFYLIIAIVAAIAGLWLMFYSKNRLFYWVLGIVILLVLLSAIYNVLVIGLSFIPLGIILLVSILINRATASTTKYTQEEKIAKYSLLLSLVFFLLVFGPLFLFFSGNLILSIGLFYMFLAAALLIGATVLLGFWATLKIRLKKNPLNN